MKWHAETGRPGSFLVAASALLVVWTSAATAVEPTYDYHAATDTPGDGIWENERTVTTVRDWTLDVNPAAPVPVTSGRTTFTQAYDFGGALVTDPTGGTTLAYQDTDLDSGGPDVAFEVWFRPSDLTGQEVLFETGGKTNGASLVLDGAQLSFLTRQNNASVDVSSTLSASDAADFLQAVGLITGSNTRLFVNGSPRAVVSGTKDWSTGNNDAGLAQIASQLGGAADNGSFGNLQGQIARIRLYSEPPSAMEVYQAFRAQAPDFDPYANAVMDKGPFAFWRLGEDAGTTVAVNQGSAGTALDGAYSGVAYGQDGLATSVNPSARFDGTSLVTLPTDAALNDSTVATRTIELWFDADSLPADGQHAVLYEQGGHSRGFNVHLEGTADGPLLVVGSWTGSNTNFLATPVAIGTGDTHHVVLSYDAPDNLMYGLLDGQVFGADGDVPEIPAHSNTSAIGGIAGGQTTFRSGNSAGDAFFSGRIDEVASYDRALSLGEIRDNFRVATGEDFGLTPGVVGGALLNYDAANAVASIEWADSLGTVAAGGTADDLTWQLADTSLQEVKSVYRNLTSAFSFADTGSGGTYSGDAGADSWMDLLPNAGFEERNATIELWFKPTDAEGKEVLFETGGGTDGFAMRLDGDVLQVRVKDSDFLSELTYDLDQGDDGLDYGDFLQAAAVIDLDAGTVELFVNGMLVDVDNDFGGGVFMGNDASGLGTIAGALAAGDAGGFGDFEGEIGILRYYPFAMSANQVVQNYGAVLAPEPSSLALALLAGVGFLFFLRRRKRK